MLEIARKRRSSTKRLAMTMIGLVILFGSAVAGYWLINSTSHKLVSSDLKPVAPKITATSLESKMLVMGDVFWGRYINDWSQKSELKFAYPFSRLAEFERDKYDAWINDMECPITNNPKVSSAIEDTTLSFDCSPEYLPEVKKWFTAMTLANNHTDNQGAEGFAETRQHLAANGIQYFGTYEPEDYDNVCDVIAMPARVRMSDNSEKQVKLPMVWCGYHGVFKTPSAESIDVMKRYTDYFPVIAMPHSGAEYKPEPDTIKTNLYRSLVDGGADVVIGDHPHWVQSSEAYKGRLIMYSLGNFIFDQQYNREVTRSALLQMTVNVDASKNSDLEKWIKLGDVCAAYQDKCLEEAKSQKLQKLSLSYKFGIEAGDNSGKIAHKASPELLADIKNRLRWQQTISGLSDNNSGE